MSHDMEDNNIIPRLKGLSTDFIGREVYYYQTVDSTMSTAKKHAREGSVEGTVILAAEQLAGRGRLQRTWFTPQGNLAMSVILKPSIDCLSQIIMVASMAVISAIKKVCGINARIKWPNDVLINSKKVCGILVESVLKKDKVDYVIIGIGMNVNLDPTLFPDIALSATSLLHESGLYISIEELSGAIANEMEKLYEQVRSGHSLHKEWQDNMETIGKYILVRSGNIIEEGIAESTRENGSLLLRRQDGSIVEIMVGDVSVVKN